MSAIEERALNRRLYGVYTGQVVVRMTDAQLRYLACARADSRSTSDVVRDLVDAARVDSATDE